MEISTVYQFLFLFCVLVTVAFWPSVSTDQMDSSDQAIENTIEYMHIEEYEEPDSSICGLDRDTQNGELSTNEKEVKEFFQCYGITEEDFDQDGKIGIDVVLEKAKMYVKDERNNDLSDLSEAERELYFIRKVKDLMDIVIIEKRKRQKEEEELDKNVFVFPKLKMLEPGQVGDVVEVELEEGMTYKRITRGIRPPVFEIPDFLSAEECDFIIQKALDSGLELSRTFGTNVTEKPVPEESKQSTWRVSQQTWLLTENLGEEFTRTLHSRVSKLTDLPVGVIRRGEPMQVVHYGPGGHYYAHIDTTDDNVLPCCFQTSCEEAENTEAWGTCCRICRYITVLYYLNDVELGGETAFPLVDMPDDLYDEKMENLPEQKWYDLGRYCYNSSLVVKPKKGKAIMWYSHFLDEDGYLGKADLRSHHGGCDLVMGMKWVANTWISAATKEGRRTPSLFLH